MKNRLVMFLCCAAFVFAEGRSLAQSVQERKAHRLYVQAKKDMNEGRLDDALSKLDDAYALFPIPHILVRKAQVLMLKGQLEEAMELLIRIDVGKDRRLKARMEALKLQIASQMNKPVEVELVSNVAGVEVIVDGVGRYLAPCTARLTRGTHQFEFRKKWYKPVLTSVRIKGPRTQTVRVELRPKTTKAIFTTNYGTVGKLVVLVDGKKVPVQADLLDQRRSQPVTLRAGDHVYECRSATGAVYTKSVTLAEDVVAQLDCKIAPPESGISARTWGWVTLASGASLAVAGSALVGWYYHKKNNPPSPDPVTGRPYVFMDRHENYIGFALLGIGVAAAGASYFLFTAKVSAHEPEETVVPLGLAVLPNSTGASAAASFAF